MSRGLVGQSGAGEGWYRKGGLWGGNRSGLVLSSYYRGRVSRESVQGECPGSVVVAQRAIYIRGNLCVYAKIRLMNDSTHTPTALPNRFLRIHDLMVGTGMSNKVMAYNLGVTEGTLKVYSSQMFSLLGVDGRINLMAGRIRSLTSRLEEAEIAANTKITAEP